MKYPKVLYTWITMYLQGGTSRYTYQYVPSKLPKCPVYLAQVYSGLRWIMIPENPVYLDYDVPKRRYINLKVQGFVLPSTLLYRRNPGIQDFRVLHCTALYRDVSSNGK